MIHSIRLAISATVFLATAFPAPAQPVFAYSNNTTNTGFALQSTGSQTVGSNAITALIADDIHADPTTIGLTVTQIEFGIRNITAGTATVRPRVRFYMSDGAGAGPGTLIPGQVYDLTPVTLTGTTQSVVTFSPMGFVVPAASANGINFWAGITFDNNFGATGATTTDLNNVGRAMYNPPTVGSSQDLAFITSAVGDFAFNNPPGSLIGPAGAPQYNFRWSFQVQPVPEPTTLVLVGFAGVVGAGRRWIRKRR